MNIKLATKSLILSTISLMLIANVSISQAGCSGYLSINDKSPSTKTYYFTWTNSSSLDHAPPRDATIIKGGRTYTLVSQTGSFHESLDYEIYTKKSDGQREHTYKYYWYANYFCETIKHDWVGGKNNVATPTINANKNGVLTINQ